MLLLLQPPALVRVLLQTAGPRPRRNEGEGTLTSSGQEWTAEGRPLGHTLGLLRGAWRVVGLVGLAVGCVVVSLQEEKVFPCLDQILHHPARKTWYKGGETEIRVQLENVSCLVRGERAGWRCCARTACELWHYVVSALLPRAQGTLTLPVPDPTKLPTLPDSVSSSLTPHSSHTQHSHPTLTSHSPHTQHAHCTLSPPPPPPQHNLNIFYNNLSHQVLLATFGRYSHSTSTCCGHCRAVIFLPLSHHLPCLHCVRQLPLVLVLLKFAVRKKNSNNIIQHGSSKW